MLRVCLAACLLLSSAPSTRAHHDDHASAAAVDAALRGRRATTDDAAGRSVVLRFGKDGSFTRDVAGAPPQRGRWWVERDGRYCEELTANGGPGKRCGYVRLTPPLAIFGGEILDTLRLEN